MNASDGKARRQRATILVREPCRSPLLSAYDPQVLLPLQPVRHASHTTVSGIKSTSAKAASLNELSLVRRNDLFRDRG